jgi:hypothetical protein
VQQGTCFSFLAVDFNFNDLCSDGVRVGKSDSISYNMGSMGLIVYGDE